MEDSFVTYTLQVHLREEFFFNINKFCIKIFYGWWIRKFCAVLCLLVQILGDKITEKQHVTCSTIRCIQRV